MANLQNCALCGSRERPSDLHLVAGKYICGSCSEDVFALFDDPRVAEEYVRNAPLAPPRDILGRLLAESDPCD